jgi:SEC-C motif domain protein
MWHKLTLLNLPPVRQVTMLCYCGSSKTFEACCQPFIAGLKPVESCEQLMRSRYSAYCSHNINYIYNSYHSSSKTENSQSALAAFAKQCHFIELCIMSSERAENEGFVSFTVKYLQHNTLCQFTERSRFILEDTWYYVDGVLSDNTPVKIGRNELCPCGSGKKFKQCTTHNISGTRNRA